MFNFKHALNCFAGVLSPLQGLSLLGLSQEACTANFSGLRGMAGRKRQEGGWEHGERKQMGRGGEGRGVEK